MPGIRLFDVRAALAALGLAMLAALAVAVVTHLPVPAASGPAAPATQASATGLSRLQSLPLQAQSVISSTMAADSRAYSAQRTGSGWGLARRWRACGLPYRRAAPEPGGWQHPVPVTDGRWHADGRGWARQPGHAHASRHQRVVRRGPARHRAGLHAGPPARRAGGRPRADAPARSGRIAARTGRWVRRELPGVARRYRGAIWGADRGRRDRASPAQRPQRQPRHACSSGQRPRRALPDHDRPARPAGRQAGAQRRDATGHGSPSGWSVAISADGNTALIGGGTSTTASIGRGLGVHALRRSTWSQQVRSSSPPTSVGDASDFGSSVALSADGNTALIGGEHRRRRAAPARRGCSSAPARRTSSRSKLTGTGELRRRPTSATSVALSADGNTALDRRPDDQEPARARRRRAWVFTRSGTTWSTRRRRSPRRRRAATIEQLRHRAWRCRRTATSRSSAAPRTTPGRGGLGVHPAAARPGPPASRSARPPATTSAPRRGSATPIAISADGNTALIGGTRTTPTRPAVRRGSSRGSGATWSQQAKLRARTDRVERRTSAAASRSLRTGTPR